MRKILLSTLVIVSALSAASHDMYPNAVTATFGRNMTTSSNNLESTTIHGLRYDQNIYNATNGFSIDAYQVALDFGSNIGYKDSTETTGFMRLGGNLLWYVDTQSNMTPFVLLGAGFSYYTNPKDPYSALSLYTNAGGGVEFQIRNDIALVGEAKYIYEGPKRESVNTNIGLKFSFGSN